MVIKIFGAIMVVFCCVAIGRLVAAQLERRWRLLGDLQQGLLALEREISYTATPLPSALASAATAGGLAASVFNETGRLLGEGSGLSAQRAWEKALEKSAVELPLSAEDIFVLTSFGRGLGLSDCQNQLKRLELSRQRLEQLEMEARQQSERLGKVWKNLGWAVGIALALICL